MVCLLPKRFPWELFSLITRIMAYVSGAISFIFLIVIFFNNTIDHNLDFKTVITSLTVALSLVTICITVVNYRKSSEIASLATFTNITKEYAARINETNFPLTDYDEIRKFLNKIKGVITFMNKRAGGIENFRDILVLYFSFEVIDELENIISLEHVMVKNIENYERSLNIRVGGKSLSEEVKKGLLKVFRNENKQVPELLECYHFITKELRLNFSKKQTDFIIIQGKKYNLLENEFTKEMGTRLEHYMMVKGDSQTYIFPVVKPDSEKH